MLTANVPHSTSRSTAWSAWEAAILELQGRRSPPRQSSHQKKFWEKYNHPTSGWWLYALDAMPNRSEVLVEKLNGDRVWISINVGAPYANVKSKQFLYKIVKEFEIERQRQIDYINKGWSPSLKDIVNGIEDSHLIPEFVEIHLRNTLDRTLIGNIVGNDEDIHIPKTEKLVEWLQSARFMKVFGLMLNGSYVLGRDKRETLLSYLDQRG